jgi:hypothetical protein
VQTLRTDGGGALVAREHFTMPERHHVHWYDYVNRPYAAVRDALASDAVGVFRRASRARDGGAELHAHVGALDVAAGIELDITSIENTTMYGQPATCIALTWHAARHPGMFPTMVGTLSIYALSSTETQLELSGTYDPPLGIVGDAIDAIALHRIADSSVRELVREVAAFLRAELPQEPGAGTCYQFATE